MSLRATKFKFLYLHASPEGTEYIKTWRSLVWSWRSYVTSRSRLHKKEKPQRGAITMGQSLVKNYVHIVFSTKYRQPLITEAVEEELYAYLGGICNALDCQPVKIGGFTDHIHILCMLSKKIALMKLLEELKAHSSKWIKTKGREFQNFYWQNGYGAFSVNPAEVERVINYIANQKDHHRKKTFQVEYRAFLKKYEVEFDEKFVWD